MLQDYTFKTAKEDNEVKTGSKLKVQNKTAAGITFCCMKWGADGVPTEGKVLKPANYMDFKCKRSDKEAFDEFWHGTPK